MQGRSVLKALDETWAKFKKFLKEDSSVAVMAPLTDDTRSKLEWLLERDVLVIVADLQAFFAVEENARAVMSKDEAFLSQLLPPEINVKSVPAATKAKLFLFARVARSLLIDLEKE